METSKQLLIALLRPRDRRYRLSLWLSKDVVTRHRLAITFAAKRRQKDRNGSRSVPSIQHHDALVHCSTSLRSDTVTATHSSRLQNRRRLQREADRSSGPLALNDVPSFAPHSISRELLRFISGRLSQRPATQDTAYIPVILSSTPVCRTHSTSNGVTLRRERRFAGLPSLESPKDLILP